MSSQRARSCQGPLLFYALLVPARALREQFQLGLGARLLSGNRRWRTARPIAGRRSEAAGSYSSLITVRQSPAWTGAGALDRRRAYPKHRLSVLAAPPTPLSLHLDLERRSQWRIGIGCIAHDCVFEC